MVPVNLSTTRYCVFRDIHNLHVCVTKMDSSAQQLHNSFTPQYPQILRIHAIKRLLDVGEGLVARMALPGSCRMHASHNAPCMDLLPDERLLHKRTSAHNGSRKSL